MKRTKMMVTTLAMAMMAMGSTTAFAAEKPEAPETEYVKLQQPEEGDMIAVKMKELSLEDMRKIEDGDFLKLTKEIQKGTDAGTVTVAYCTEDGDKAVVLPEKGDLELAKLDADGTDAYEMTLAIEAEDFDLEDLKEIDWLPVNGKLEISDETVTGPDGEEMAVKIVKLVDAAQNK